MPDQNQNSRPEKPKRSVLETNHPVFAKVKRELPMLQPRMLSSKHPQLEKLKQWLGSAHIIRLACIVGVASVLSFFIYRQITDPFLDYKLNDIAQRHLIADRTMEIVDEETTLAKRKVALDAILSVYDYDRRISGVIRGRIERAFQQMRRQHQDVVSLVNRRNISPEELEKSESFLRAKKTFSEIAEIDISDAQFAALARTSFHQRVEKLFTHLVADANLNLIVSNREMLKSEIGKGISLNRIDEGMEKRTEQVFHNIGAIIDVDTVRADVEGKAKNFFANKLNLQLAPYADKIISVGKRFIQPNLTLNRQETERRKAAVHNEIKPVVVKINKGDNIVRYREIINARHLAILKQMQAHAENSNFRFQFFFTTIFLSLLIYSLVAFLSGGMQAFKLSGQDLAALAVLMVATILTIKGLQFIVAEALLESIPQLPFDFYYYLVPVAAGPVIVRMLMDKEPSLVFAVVLSIVGGILLERNFFYAAYILTSSLIASQLAHTIKTRSVIYRAGLLTGLANVAMITCIIANTRNAASLSMLWQDMEWIVAAGLLSGLALSMMVVSLVPIVELISGRTSDLRLLELANMNHPLLRDLMVKAPGTYHHCIVIGSLVEAAAEAIGANPLMARVMAYYHDVGKTERPLYFIENQGGGYNRHDGLQPHMSAMIIREHVKRGQELGRKHKLPQPLIDAMSEHHGSSTIAYFYNKARSQAEDPDSVLESDYKYDGTKPQSKETALVMLGDVVEAATRSVADPTPIRLNGVVKNILNKYFAEGQLSECNLTLRDLDLIAKSFLDVLLGIYHARIEYGVPSIRDGARKKHGGSDSKGSARQAGGGGMAPSASAAPYTKPFPVPGSGGGGSKKS